MKKIRITVIVLMVIILILIGIFLVINLVLSDNDNMIIATNEVNTNDVDIDEISNYIVFELAEYDNIENVVFYNKTAENVVKENEDNFKLIANELKNNYLGKSILFLNYLGYQSLWNAEMYRCMQIVNGQKIDDTSMNVLVKEDGSVEFDFLSGCGWKKSVSLDYIKITEEDAEQITIDYLAKNPDYYNELKNGFFSGDNEKCTVELYFYESKTCWKMQFSTGSSFIIIDASSGEILNEYFSDGIIID